MKFGKINILIITLLLIFIGTGCENEEFYIDENEPITAMPGISVYKTKANYFDKVNVWVNDQGEIDGCPEFIENSSKITLINGKYHYARRYHLDNGYTLSKEITDADYFTDITYDEYVREKMSPIYNDGFIPEEVKSRVTDTDPFIEFYYFSTLGGESFTIKQINQLIKDN
ncbi:MAG: hypothetical protein JXR31_00325, partial [Prolixibacteraceae bacterium]|nr:hypothetical protein [Prolixibacteraceae bacterium]